MQFIRISLCAILLVLGTISKSAFAADVPASEASIRELIEVTQSRKMLDGLMAQTAIMLKAQIQQSIPGKKYTAKQQEILNEMQNKIVAVFIDEMKWESLEPMFVDIYKKSFTQSDMDDMISFYKSKAGQNMIAKMPLVMQNTMQAMQGRMALLMPKLEKIQNETITQMKAAKNN